MILDIVERTGLGEQVAHHLRRRIISGEVAPGQHLVESALSAEFAVSRGPVRDALRDLEAEGLVEAGRQGVRVVGLQADDIGELYSLRESIESLAIRLCIERNSPDAWQRFEAPLQRMAGAADRHDAGAFASADLDFHSLFYELSGHRRLFSVWMHYEPTVRVLLEVTTRQDADLHPVYQAHADILNLGKSGDADAAVLELNAHLLGSSNRLRSALAQVLERRKAAVDLASPPPGAAPRRARA